jgi:hypothetical protein
MSTLSYVKWAESYGTPQIDPNGPPLRLTMCVTNDVYTSPSPRLHVVVLAIDDRGYTCQCTLSTSHYGSPEVLALGHGTTFELLDGQDVVGRGDFGLPWSVG